MKKNLLPWEHWKMIFPWWRKRQLRPEDEVAVAVAVTVGWEGTNRGLEVINN